jgi:NADPH-dependent glutamate synthase beta subunit-like oxidoreductase
MNMKFGEDFTVATLKEAGYDAIFLGIGAWKDYSLRAEGEDLERCYTGISFLTAFASNQQSENPKGFPIRKKCVVIGGGNTAIDCVRTLVRLGAEEVTILYRRTRAEMPANLVEIEAAEHEGVNFHFMAAPTRVIGDENGRVKQLEYLKCELGEPDASGRRRPVPIEGSETLLDIDMLVTAIGQGPDASFKDKDADLADLELTRWSTIDNDPEILQANIPYIFTGGDSATGASLVVEAIGGGRRAARSIHLYLMGQDEKAEEPVEVTIPPVPKSLLKKHIPESLFDKVPGVGKKKRTPMPEMEVAIRINCFDEADLVISEKDAKYESNRCLNCCRICYNKDAAA